MSAWAQVPQEAACLGRDWDLDVPGSSPTPEALDQIPNHDPRR